jgi:hypothetical protein
MGIAAELRGQRLLAPSILSADFARLGEEVDLLLDLGVRLVHVDVMDGHFVPNLTVGPALVAALASRVHERDAFLDVHLMIEQPDRFLADFAAAGADALSVHIEACPHLHRTLTAVRALGLSAGVAINPATDLSVVGEALNFCDYVLAMSVNPGFDAPGRGRAGSRRGSGSRQHLRPRRGRRQLDRGRLGRLQRRRPHRGDHHPHRVAQPVGGAVGRARGRRDDRRRARRWRASCRVVHSHGSVERSSGSGEIPYRR